MSAHTPGPWRLNEYFVEGKYGSSDRWVCEIACPNNNLIVAEIPEYRTYPEETPMVEANARLIASAPELLEALRAFDRWNYEVKSARVNGESLYSYDDLQNMRAEAERLTDTAIAKATDGAA